MSYSSVLYVNKHSTLIWHQNSSSTVSSFLFASGDYIFHKLPSRLKMRMRPLDAYDIFFTVHCETDTLQELLLIDNCHCIILLANISFF